MNPFKRIRDFARELMGQPVKEDTLRAAAEKHFGKSRSKSPERVDATRFLEDTRIPPVEAKADLTPRIVPPSWSPGPQSPPAEGAEARGLPPLPEPVAIPARMWLAGAIGALLAPRAAGAMLTAPLRWKQQQDTDAQRHWQQQVQMLLKQLELELKAREVGAKEISAKADVARADAYAKDVDNRGQLIPTRVAEMEARTQKLISDTLVNQFRIQRDQADILSNLYLRAGDPRVGADERGVLLTFADDYARRVGLDPVAARATAGVEPPALAPAQERALAEAENLESLAELNRARQDETESAAELNRARAEYTRTQTRYYEARTAQLPKELELEEKRVQAALMSASAALKNADTNARQLALDGLVESFDAVNTRIIRYQKEIDGINDYLRELGRQVPAQEVREAGPNGEIIVRRTPDWSRAPAEVIDARNKALRTREQLRQNIGRLQNRAGAIQQEIERFR